MLHIIGARGRGEGAEGGRGGKKPKTKMNGLNGLHGKKLKFRKCDDNWDR
jgi:hypothetical protein